jgi:beta-lactamase class A
MPSVKWLIPNLKPLDPTPTRTPSATDPDGQDRTSSGSVSQPPRTPRHALINVVLAALVVSLLASCFALLHATSRPASQPAAQAPSGRAAFEGVDAASHAPAGPTMLGLDALSPELADYVADVKRSGIDIGVVIYDVTGNRYYSYNQNETFTLASSAKVYILCGYLDMLERQGRQATANERAQMYAMITRSDNNAAQWLYNRLGQASGQQHFLERNGITDYVSRGYDWGWARLSPASMVHLLSLLQTGKILNAADRNYALDLMGHVDLGRWGVGDTAPDDARIYMKDGWVTGPDGHWAQNSSGIVITATETYIISVYTQHLPGYDWSQVQHVCRAIAQILR